LQEGINRAVIDHSTLVGQDHLSVINRRQALMSLGLIPVHLVRSQSGKSKRGDTDTLLTHCAAGITAAWYLRRGKELKFANDLTSSYISILQPLVYSQSEAYRKASAQLLSQSFRLKGSITEHLKKRDPATISYHNEAIKYAQMAENTTEQAIANRMAGFSYWHQEEYEQALLYAEKAYGLVRSKSIPRNIQSFMASGLALCQAVNGKIDDANISLAEARNLFDPTMPIPSMHYTESNLLAISADVSQHRGMWQESVDLWVESLATPDISTLGSIQARINYAKTEVSRDDQPRNMDLCITLLTEAITGAKELDNKHYVREAREAYNLFRIAWPREDAIKQLGKKHFGQNEQQKSGY